MSLYFMSKPNVDVCWLLRHHNSDLNKGTLGKLPVKMDSHFLAPGTPFHLIRLLWSLIRKKVCLQELQC